MITLFFSGVQKIIVLTILFGNTLWKSINIFIKQVANEFLSLGFQTDIHYGYLLIGLYVFIHLSAGVIIGLYAGSLPVRISLFTPKMQNLNFDESGSDLPKKDKKGKKKSWLLRPTGIFILLLSSAVLIYTYLNPSYKEITSIEILVMLVRSVLLTLLWYALFAPLVRKALFKNIC